MWQDICWYFIHSFCLYIADLYSGTELTLTMVVYIEKKTGKKDRKKHTKMFYFCFRSRYISYMSCKSFINLHCIGPLAGSVYKSQCPWHNVKWMFQHPMQFSMNRHLGRFSQIVNMTMVCVCKNVLSPCNFCGSLLPPSSPALKRFNTTLVFFSPVCCVSIYINRLNPWPWKDFTDLKKIFFGS